MKKLILVCLGSWFISPAAWAVFGVGDVVIVASNPAQELLWATKELPQWLEMLSKTQQQVNKAQEMINIAGDPQRFASGIVSSSISNLSLTEEANKLAAGKEVLRVTEANWKLLSGNGSASGDELRVEDSFSAMGKTVKRTRDKYVKLAMEKALNSRVKEAAEKKQSVDTKELAFQRDTMAKLSAAKTQSEIALHQASILASRQRMDVANARVVQAQAELLAYQNDIELERARDAKQTQDWAETVISRAGKEVSGKTSTTGSRPKTPIGPEGWNEPAT